jgi:protein-S-isoprenylcysteine O-methyltransferase Ste14
MGKLLKTEQVEIYENLLSKIKKGIARKKKALPYYLAVSILLLLGFFTQLENTYNKFFGNSTDFIILLVSLYLSLWAIYIIIIFWSIRVKEKEMKSIKSKMYDLMKLENS